MTIYVAKVDNILSDYEYCVAVEGESEDEVRDKLSSQGYFVYEVWEESDE